MKGTGLAVCFISASMVSGCGVKSSVVAGKVLTEEKSISALSFDKNGRPFVFDPKMGAKVSSCSERKRSINPCKKHGARLRVDEKNEFIVKITRFSGSCCYKYNIAGNEYQVCDNTVDSCPE